MTDFLSWFTEVSLGEPGQALLDVIQNNFTIFLGVVFLYGMFLLYARIILTSYLPKKLREFVELKIQKQNSDYEVDALIEEWENELKQLPWYIVVPSKNELWVKRPTKYYRQTKRLAYRRSEQYEDNDRKRIKYLINRQQTQS